jgi:hypothetical protein
LLRVVDMAAVSGSFIGAVAALRAEPLRKLVDGLWIGRAVSSEAGSDSGPSLLGISFSNRLGGITHENLLYDWSTGARAAPLGRNSSAKKGFRGRSSCW